MTLSMKQKYPAWTMTRVVRRQVGGRVIWLVLYGDYDYPWSRSRTRSAAVAEELALVRICIRNAQEDPSEYAAG